MSGKVSVIIPIYNKEDFLTECLETVIHQSLNDIEIVCVNDGSTDDSLKIVKQYAQNDNRFLVINQKNAGVAVARNNGLRQASGEFVCFLDPDDFYPNDEVLEHLYTNAIEHDALICGGSFSSYDNNRKLVSTYYPGIWAPYTFHKEGMIDFKDYQYDFGYQRFIFKTSLIKENNLFFPLLKRFQDPPFFVDIMLKAGKFYAIPEVVYRYRCGFQTRSNKFSSEKFCDMLKGQLHNLIVSREQGLANLHALTIFRIEDAYCVNSFVDRLLKKDMDVFYLLFQLNANIDTDLLHKNTIGLKVEGEKYFLAEVRKYLQKIDELKCTKTELLDSQKTVVNQKLEIAEKSLEIAERDKKILDLQIKYHEI